MDVKKAQKIIDTQYAHIKDKMTVRYLNDYYNRFLFDYLDPFFNSISKSGEVSCSGKEKTFLTDLDRVLKVKLAKINKYEALKQAAITATIEEVSKDFGIEEEKIKREDVKFLNAWVVSVKGVSFSYDATFSRRSFDIYLHAYTGVLKDILKLQIDYDMQPIKMLKNLKNDIKTKD